MRVRASAGGGGLDQPAPAGRRPGVPRLLWTALAALAGAAIGAAYSHFVGCRTGTCLITSNIWIASLYGGVVGALIGMPSSRAAQDRSGPRGA